jgi:hypothetical protein
MIKQHDFLHQSIVYCFEFLTGNKHTPINCIRISIYIFYFILLACFIFQNVIYDLKLRQQQFFSFFKIYTCNFSICLYSYWPWSFFGGRLRRCWAPECGCVWQTRVCTCGRRRPSCWDVATTPPASSSSYDALTHWRRSSRRSSRSAATSALRKGCE